jgi:hypothetical protein
VTLFKKNTNGFHKNHSWGSRSSTQLHSTRTTRPGFGSRTNLHTVQITHYAKHIQYMEPQKHYFFSCQYLHNWWISKTHVFLTIPMQFQLRNNLPKHGTLPPKFPAHLRAHIYACVCVCVYAYDRDRKRTHAYARHLIFKKHVGFSENLRYPSVTMRVTNLYYSLRLSLSQQCISDKLRPLPPVYPFPLCLV